MNKKLIKVVALILTMATGVIMFGSCDLFKGPTATPSVPDPTWDAITEGQFMERPKVANESVVELLGDLLLCLVEQESRHSASCYYYAGYGLDNICHYRRIDIQIHRLISLSLLISYFAVTLLYT